MEGYHQSHFPMIAPWCEETFCKGIYLPFVPAGVPIVLLALWESSPALWIGALVGLCLPPAVSVEKLSQSHRLYCKKTPAVGLLESDDNKRTKCYASLLAFSISFIKFYFQWLYLL